MRIDSSLSGKALKPADLLGIGCFEGDKHFQKFLAGKEFSAKKDEILFVPAPPSTERAVAILLIGLGKREKARLENVRRAAAKLLCQGKSYQCASVRFDLDTFAGKYSLEEAAGAAVEGARLSDYRFDKYKSKPGSNKKVETFNLVSKNDGKAAAVRRAIAESEIITGGVIFTRDLANEPANVMTPVRLAQEAKAMAAKNNLICKVLGKNEIRRLKMGGILAVSQGSSFPPQLIILENKVKNASHPIVLVGKGVTFDTGGISIKPSTDMDKMKFDMSGAAAVIGTMKVIANLKLPVKVVGIAPVVENMPGSKAQRPGDIIKCYNGKTVEVLNTDAEGRLILADALSYAAKYKPKALLDIATLTGACAATFGDLAIGLMGTDPDLVRRVKEAGEHTGERCWELPLWDEYFNFIKATYADIQNIGKKYAGTITAGMFLKEFADHTKSWAHLDVAGTAWNESGPKPLSPIGSTGVGVRLFTRLIQGFLHK